MRKKGRENKCGKKKRGNQREAWLAVKTHEEID